jgi:hypothetical protein
MITSVCSQNCASEYIVSKYILLAAVCVVFSSKAGADITITAGPGNFENDENVAFNQEGLLDVGPIVQGMTNQSMRVVDFFGAGEDLITPSAGQARVEAVDGLLTDLSLKMNSPSYSISTLVWNINADADGQVEFTIVRTGGPNHVATFDLDGAGENWFMMEAIGESMTMVSFSTNVGIEDVRQVRLGSVPEPASMLALALGAGLVAARRRWRGIKSA